MRAAAVALAVCLLALACGSSSGPRPQATLAPPPVDPRLNVLSQGEIALDVPAGGKQSFDPLALARAAGQPPDCASFVFLFSWQLTTDGGAGLRFTGSRMGGTFDVGFGSRGTASVEGCILLEAHNDTRDRLTGQMRYFIASTR